MWLQKILTLEYRCAPRAGFKPLLVLRSSERSYKRENLEDVKNRRSKEEILAVERKRSRFVELKQNI